MKNFSGSGGRRRILDNGNLIIRPVSRDDAGVYSCSASNMYGNDESSGRLIILRKKFSGFCIFTSFLYILFYELDTMSSIF